MYDDFVQIGKDNKQVYGIVYRSIDYISRANLRLQIFNAESDRIILTYVEKSINNVKNKIYVYPQILSRFFVNSVEFLARIDHATSILNGSGINDIKSTIEWMQNENNGHVSSTPNATLFNMPLSLSLAHDSEWIDIDDSPRTRMLIWGILSSANVIAGHLLSCFKTQSGPMKEEVQEMIYSHLRTAWIGYLSQLLEPDDSSSDRAVFSYLETIVSEPNILNVYGMHMMNVFRNQLYVVHTQADNYEHFASLVLP